MISEKMINWGRKRSVIREIFEYGRARAKLIGADNVFDFTLGNPSIPTPDCVKETILKLLETKDSVALHGYTLAQGDEAVRKAVADSITERFGAKVGTEHIYMTSGAAASLSISLKALAVPGDEFIVFTPFFPEYGIFIESAGGKLVAVPTKAGSFQIDSSSFEKAITSNTKAVIVNSPNNPSGVVLSAESIDALCGILVEKSKEYGQTIYLISDEPYREIVYEDTEVPYLMNYYDNTLVCYSFSKSLSLPGERIGYIAVSDKMHRSDEVYAAVCGAGRALGYVCASSLFQMVIAECIGKTADISIYRRNRDLLYNGLTDLGFQCIRPDGAFYLFIKAMEEDAGSFCEKAKRYELLLVPGDDFGCPGYVRIAYCVKTEQIQRSIPAFKKLVAEYK